MKKLYPLKFRPILKERVWGGDSLVKRFNKQVPLDDEGNPTVDSSHIGETWELVNLGEESSVICNGFLADNDLADILETYMGDLVGDTLFDFYNLQFPLLVKMLNINEFLSVQVHPDDETAIERYDSYGKTECWYVMEADESATVYMGFKRDTSASEFYAACKNGTAQDLMNEFHPHKGDCFYIKAGTVHSAGGGLVIAEVQESSDITFRLYDWGRENDPGTCRQMHLDEALDCIDYRQYDEAANYVRSRSFSSKIVDDSHFVVNDIFLDKEKVSDTGLYDSFVLYICTEGTASIKTDGGEPCIVSAGEMAMVPAALDSFTLVSGSADAHLLEVYVPAQSEADTYLQVS